ncbi:IclR family transcriptional regulator [Scopulibacillus darangshiensis]|uniref:IclR family transcriptional regulator n=1 Tax=Scopulibacillus darangshiensis TaxID=442528 RepID=A0A4R2P4E9_9BACL|nr:IclR family transcriptional regulator [Scopulibacillus darangshiensis]TCP29622.1 IclR family transcriptional regulator [Scopulibacillus darangshiensis]
MQSIDRAMQTIEVLASNDIKKWFSITELSKACDLPVSTMHRLLASMKKHGLIQQDPELKLYSLGNTWLEYGLQLYDSLDFVSLIRPEMEKLMIEVEESIYFSKPFGLESLVVERIDCLTNPIRINDQLGIRIPMNIGAANKVMLAHMPQDEAVKIVNALLTGEEKDAFVDLLNSTKQKGYGISHGEKTQGTSSVAAPVFNQLRELIGAISIGYVNFNITEERQNLLIEKAVAFGMRISSKLGYKP